jgi:hypothetical protein
MEKLPYVELNYNPEKYVRTELVLTEESREYLASSPLLTKCPWTIHCHHVTLHHHKAHPPVNNPEELWQPLTFWITPVALVITEELIAIQVKTQAICFNEFPHITIATAPGVQPVAANNALRVAKKHAFTNIKSLLGQVRLVNMKGCPCESSCCHDPDPQDSAPPYESYEDQFTTVCRNCGSSCQCDL